MTKEQHTVPRLEMRIPSVRVEMDIAKAGASSVPSPVMAPVPSSVPPPVMAPVPS